jgi:KUP system potassium uptake protein
VVVETSFFVANAVKLLKRLFFLVFEIGLITTMYVWYNARKITLQMLTFLDIKEYLPLLEKLSNDRSTIRFSTHLAYFTKASNLKIEKRIVDSIFSNMPKRADFYWFVNIERSDDPYTMEYDVHMLSEKKVARVNFRLGFRIQPRIGLFLRKVAEDMVAAGEIQVTCRQNDFKFVILERFLSYDNEFSTRDGFILNTYFSILQLARSDSRAYGIDIDLAVIEKVPLVVAPIGNIHLKRVGYTIDRKESGPDGPDSGSK